MKDRKPQQTDVKDAIDAVKDLESNTGVKIRSGLRAGGGGGTGKGGTYQPLYGAPTGSDT
ncbi:MAG: hypothetical protein R3F59_34980 [Myxococcota bacterium]